MARKGKNRSTTVREEEDTRGVGRSSGTVRGSDWDRRSASKRRRRGSISHEEKQYGSSQAREQRIILEQKKMLRREGQKHQENLEKMAGSRYGRISGSLIIIVALMGQKLRVIQDLSALLTREVIDHTQQCWAIQRLNLQFQRGMKFGDNCARIKDSARLIETRVFFSTAEFTRSSMIRSKSA